MSDSKPKKRKKKAPPKKQAKPSGIERGWFTRTELAAIFGVSISQVDRHYAQMVGEECRKKAGGKTYYKARAIIDAVVAAELQKRGTAAELVGGDPLLEGAETPALEEFRRIRAAQEKIKLSEMEGKSIPLDQLESALMEGTAVWTRYAEVMVKRFGNEAGQLLQEANEEWVRMVEKVLGGANHDIGTC